MHSTDKGRNHATVFFSLNINRSKGPISFLFSHSLHFPPFPERPTHFFFLFPFFPCPPPPSSFFAPTAFAPVQIWPCTCLLSSLVSLAPTSPSPSCRRAACGIHATSASYMAPPVPRRPSRLRTVFNPYPLFSLCVGLRPSTPVSRSHLLPPRRCRPPPPRCLPPILSSPRWPVSPLFPPSSSALAPSSYPTLIPLILSVAGPLCPAGVVPCLARPRHCACHTRLARLPKGGPRHGTGCRAVLARSMNSAGCVMPGSANSAMLWVGQASTAHLATSTPRLP